MNLVEKEALRFKTKLFQKSQNLQLAKNTLVDKINVFNRPKDRLYFLNILRKVLNDQKIEHEKTCTTEVCGTSINLNNALFVIDQEIDDINDYYEPATPSDDNIPTELRVEIHSRINEAIEKLEKLSLGQEVIFNEIDELKEHFNLGKKKWLQLLKGKLVDLGISYAVEKTVLDTIYNTIVQDIDKLPSSFIDLL